MKNEYLGLMRELKAKISCLHGEDLRKAKEEFYKMDYKVYLLDLGWNYIFDYIGYLEFWNLYVVFCKRHKNMI